MEETKSTATASPVVIPPEPAPPAKPKRVLTEAQRLAFIKGREKRLANLERKRMEKEEAKMLEATQPPDISAQAKPVEVVIDTKVEIDEKDTIIEKRADQQEEEVIYEKLITKIKEEYNLERKDTPHPAAPGAPVKPKMARVRTVKKEAPAISTKASPPPTSTPPQNQTMWL